MRIYLYIINTFWTKYSSAEMMYDNNNNTTAEVVSKYNVL